VAHEIRNPLGGIELYVSSLIGQLEDEKALRWLHSIADAVEKLKRIVSDLLLFARDNVSSKQNLVLNNVVEQAIYMLKPEADEKKIQIQLSGEENIQVIGDEVHLQQVLTNLIRNSMDFLSKDGLIRIDGSQEKQWIVVKVEDNGPGIHPHIVPQIFDPFYTTRPSGTGLGLAISLKLVENMGGSLKYYTPDAGGAGFELRLPAVK
jgi:signal transduction histidine kinase